MNTAFDGQTQAEYQRCRYNDLMQQQQQAAYNQSLQASTAAAYSQSITWLGSMAGLYGYGGKSEPTPPFPRDKYKRESIWRRRLMRIETKRWDKRRILLGEWAWKLGIVWGGIASIALTIVFIGWLLRLIIG